MCFAFFHLVKSRACLFFGDSLKEKKIPGTQGFGYCVGHCSRATKKDTLLRAFHAENCFSGSLGSQELCCLPAFGTYCILDSAYFKLGTDSKGVLPSPDLVKILT